MAQIFKRGKKLGEGTYAVVYEGITEDGKKVAIKAIKLAALKNGLDVSAVRELKFLKKFRHPNLIHVSTFLDAFR